MHLIQPLFNYLPAIFTIISISSMTFTMSWFYFFIQSKMWILSFRFKNVFYPIPNFFHYAVTVTGPADAEPPPPDSLILDVVPVAKV
jgi:hypothetical protein